MGLKSWFIKRKLNGWREDALRRGGIVGNVIQKLNGNNRIIALAVVLVAGAIQGLAGVDVSQYVGYIFTVIGVDPNFPKEFGLDVNLTQILFAVYAIFAIFNALLKRKAGKDEKGSQK
jgi:hypothetical protein